VSDLNLALTAAGQALKAKIEMGKGTLPLNITRIVTASGYSDDPLNLTAGVDERQEFTITERRAIGPRTAITAIVTNIGLAAGYSLTQILFYAMDPDLGEILYRISQYETPNYVPAATERGWTYNPTFNFVTGNASEVIVNIDPAGIVNKWDVYNSVELSSANIPSVGVRTHYRVAGNAPNYRPITPPQPDPDAGILDIDWLGEQDGFIMQNNGYVASMALQSA
jgi:hypothetical protein